MQIVVSEKPLPGGVNYLARPCHLMKGDRVMRDGRFGTITDVYESMRGTASGGELLASVRWDGLTYDQRGYMVQFLVRTTTSGLMVNV